MSRCVWIASCFTVAMYAGWASGGTFRHGVTPLKNRYIVVLQDDISSEEVQGLARSLTKAHGGRLLATMEHAMRGFGVWMPEAAATALSKNPLVKMVEEDELIEFSPSGSSASRFDFLKASEHAKPPQASSLTSCPNSGAGYFLCTYSDDTFWHLDRIDNTGLLYGYKAYAYNSFGTGVRAYVVDYGVYASHSEFEGRVEAGANMLMDPEIADPVGPNDPPNEEPPIALDPAPASNPCGGWRPDVNANAGHGTGVASVIGGTTTGVAKNVTIVPVKVFNCDNQSSKLAMARALDWIQLDMQPRPGRAVVNMSFAITINANTSNHVCEDGHGGWTNCLSAVENEVASLVDQEIVVVTSANNQNNNRCATQSPARMGYGNEAGFPSTFRTITVGGTMALTPAYADVRWTCAAMPGGCVAPWGGANPGSNFGPCVSIWAPAWNVRVAGASGPNSYRDAGGASSGTSFAAPAVAGAVARLLGRYPNLTAQQVWSELVNRANLRVNPPDFDPSVVVNRRLLYMSPYD